LLVNVRRLAVSLPSPFCRH